MSGLQLLNVKQKIAALGLATALIAALALSSINNATAQSPADVYYEMFFGHPDPDADFAAAEQLDQRENEVYDSCMQRAPRRERMSYFDAHTHVSRTRDGRPASRATRCLDTAEAEKFAVLDAVLQFGPALEDEFNLASNATGAAVAEDALMECLQTSGITVVANEDPMSPDFTAAATADECGVEAARDARLAATDMAATAFDTKYRDDVTAVIQTALDSSPGG